jgi:peptidoglycan/LPS O-acetylase OafA/YrhL
VKTLKYRSDIDGLRAVAVISVVLFHIAPKNLPGGFLGVDIFFVISGYLISLIVFREQETSTFSLANFYLRRALRLFPALAIVLLATIVFGAFTLFADEFQRLGKHALSAIVFVLNFQLTNESGYFDVASDSKPLLHLWSLSVEEQFYLVWPALLILLGQLRWRIGMCIGMLIVVSFAYAIYIASRNLDALYFNPFARFWELLLGAALASYHYRFGVNALPSWLDHPWKRNLLSFVGLSSIFSALFLFGGKVSHPGAVTLIPTLGVTAVIASGSGSVGSRFLAIKPLVWIGLISYPLYLWHWPLLSYIRIMESGSPDESLLWYGAGAALLLAALTNRFIEQPFRQSRRVRPTMVGLGSIMVVLFLASLGVVVSKGFPDRPAIRNVKAAEAQMKREPPTDESCLSNFPPGTAPTYCRQHNPMSPMIAIVGDSHAHVLFPGVSENAALKGYGTLLLANSGCPPLVGAVTGRNEHEKISCKRRIDSILNAIAKDRRIVAVVLATRGPQYLTGTGFGPAEANYNDPPIASSENIDATDTPSPYDVFSRGLKESVTRFNQRGLRVVYVLQVPELGVPAQNCILRPLTFTENKVGCYVNLSVYQERMRDYWALVAKLALKVDTEFFSVVDSGPVFCDSSRCSGVSDGQLLYADDNHLSVLGSKKLAPIILQTLFPSKAVETTR